MDSVERTNEQAMERAVQRCRERNITIPTFAQLKDPTTIPQGIRDRLGDVGLWDVDPVNLFRITWKNEPVERGGGFNRGNWIEFPSELTGVPARIVGLVGKHFPTGAHKVGAAFGCLVPRLVSGQFDPTAHKAVWPSTGNFCRGGAYDCALLGCTGIAILPEEMSPERFEWLKSIGAEVIATPGCESNVKEIYDKCWEIRRTRPDCVIFNQFEEFGNAVWHYHLTGGIIDEIFQQLIPSEPRTSVRADDRSTTSAPRGLKSAARVVPGAPGATGGLPTSALRLAAYVSATGSGGTIAAGDYLRTRYPQVKVIATEALQCPTLLRCGFGGHRIEGIGDKHVPWIHNVRNTDMIVAVDDEQCLTLLRLFNEDAGRSFLEREGVARDTIDQLPLLGISGICNLVAAIKTAKHYELDSQDVIFTPLTDSVELYQSRLTELRTDHGPYAEPDAARHFGRYIEGIGPDHLRELGYHDRKQLHNLKYFTWVEQQQRTVDDLNRLWDPGFWTDTFAQVDEWDRRIEQFNTQVGIAK